MHTLFCALGPNEYNRVSLSDNTKEIWDKLEVTYEGISRVKESKISLLTLDYELFKAKPFNKAKRFPIRDIIKGEPSKKKKDPIICYKCKKSGHIKFDCPQLKKKGALRQKKKAMMTTWSDSDSSDNDEDNEVDSLCLITIEEPKNYNMPLMN
ncbi:hypothetical protein V6Z12_D01G130200 [Gossypium hirsutum]